jgi:hypothetical protein
VFGDYRTIFPNTSFTNEGPNDEFLAEQSAKKLNRFKPYDALTQKLEQVEPYDDGEFVSVVQVSSLTAQEVQSAKDAAMANIRAQRDRLLAASDWTQLADTPSDKRAAWATYRQALRNFPATIQDARLPVEWPKDPNYKPKND